MRQPAPIDGLIGHDWSVFDRAPRAPMSPADGVRLGDELRRQVARVQPAWPSARERRDDHAAHLRVIELLERVPPRRG
ncbi:MAG TPA: hypothetical protein VGM56_16250 [Byssovorax sp.]|jgi:hypothetical protein